MSTHLSLLNTIWHIHGKKKEGESLARAFFRLRKYKDNILRDPTCSLLASPFVLSDTKKAVSRIMHAKKKGETILLFGDFDLDGASGVATLYFALKAAGMRPICKLPSRNEGYGLSKMVYDEAKLQNVSLIITVDCGSSSAEAIAYGNEHGVDTIVTDHHTLPSVLPPAYAILHPHRGTPEDEMWHITGSGVAFFLGMAILRTVFPEKNIDGILEQLAELAMLGTIADVGKLVGQNRLLTQIGLNKLKQTSHPGLRELLSVSRTEPNALTAETIAFFLAPRLNAAGRMAHPHIALRLLLGDATAAKELETLNTQRRETTDDLVRVAEEMISDSHSPCFFLRHDDFFPGVAGLIASHIAEKYNRPTIVFSRSHDHPDMLVASCRGPEDFHLADALEKCSDVLHKHGGHAQAAGLAIHKKHISTFEEQLTALVHKERGDAPMTKTLTLDCDARIADFFSEDIDDIFRAAPFGVGNPTPIFFLPRVFLQSIRYVGGKKEHLFGELTDGTRSIPCIAFRFAPLVKKEDDGRCVDVAVSLEKSVWKGKVQTKARIVDMRFSEEKEENYRKTI